MTDDNLELTVSITRCKNGGAYRKLRDLVHNDIIRKNKMNLFYPTNITNKLCLAICLAHYLNPEAPDDTLEHAAIGIQTRVGLDVQQKIGFKDVSKCERALGVKIVVLYRSGTNNLLKYQSSDTPQSRTVFLYLHDEHYYMIRNLKAFLGVPYVCQFCYAGFTCRRDHRCKYSCDVCNDAECCKIPKKAKYCVDCLRYCRSDYCFF